MFLGKVLAAVGALVAAGGTAVRAQTPGDCSGDCWAHDPALIRRDSDGTFFRFTTGSEIGIYKGSDSIEGPWTYEGSVVPDGSMINKDGRTDLWAPDVHMVDGQYILYYAVSSFGSQDSAIGYATSSTMEAGEWTDHGSTGVESVSGSDYNSIDPNLAGSGGQYYLNFGSFWGGIYQVSMNGGATESTGTPYQIEYQPSGDHATEGSYLYEKNGYWYLFWSEGSCCGYDNNMPAPGDEYRIRVCRGSSITGPFSDSSGSDCTNGAGETVLESHDNIYGPGGEGVYYDGGQDILYYHYVDTNIGYADGDKQFGWNYLDWSSDWPVPT